MPNTTFDLRLRSHRARQFLALSLDKKEVVAATVGSTSFDPLVPTFYRQWRVSMRYELGELINKTRLFQLEHQRQGLSVRQRRAICCLKPNGKLSCGKP